MALDLNNVQGYEGFSFYLSEEMVGGGDWCTKEKCKCGGNVWPYAAEVPGTRNTERRQVEGCTMPVTTWEEQVLCICSSCEKILFDYRRPRNNYPGHRIT
jgi:hypothetical protein